MNPKDLFHAIWVEKCISHIMRLMDKLQLSNYIGSFWQVYLNLDHVLIYIYVLETHLVHLAKINLIFEYVWA